MKKINALAMLSLSGAVLLTAGCTQDQAETSPLLSPFYATASMVSKQQVEDRKIVDIIMTVDKNEIAAANVAATKQINPRVKRYAAYLHQQHEQNLSQLVALAQNNDLQPLASTTSSALVNDGRQELKMLNGLTGSAFEKAYIKAMIDGHKAGLKLIDTTLLPQAKTPSLKSFLKTTREMVVHHLRSAIRLQHELK